MRVLVIFISLICSTAALGQISFFRYYSNNGADFGQGVVQLADSSYVVTGGSSSYVEGASQVFLLKVDSTGEQIWSFAYGGPETDWGRRVLHKENDGFYVAGYSNSFGQGDYDYYLFKTDENGTLQWENFYGNTGWEKVHDAALTQDTGVMMIGESSSIADGNLDMYIVRTDKNGDTLWTKRYGTGGDDMLTSIRQFNDSLFFIAGTIYVPDSNYAKAYMAQIQDDGTVHWEKYFGGNGKYWFNDLEIQGNRIVGVGGTSEAGKDSIDLLFANIDFTGLELGILEIPNPGDHENMLITAYGPTNNFYIAYNYIDQWTFPGGVDIQVAKYLPNFAWQSSTPISNVDPDIPGQLIRTNDGGAIITGYSTGQVSGGNEMFLVKIGPNDDYPSNANAIIDDIVYIEELEENVKFSIFPNPASQLINVEVDHAEYATVELINIEGKSVMEQPIHFGTSLAVDNLKQGYYIISITGANVPPIRRKVMIAK